MKDDDTDAQVKTLLHEHRIGRLEESDEHQWDKIRDHSSWFQELHITLKLVKIGIGFLSFVAFAMAIWLRGGWEALASFVLGK